MSRKFQTKKRKTRKSKRKNTRRRHHKANMSGGHFFGKHKRLSFGFVSPLTFFKMMFSGPRMA